MGEIIALITAYLGSTSSKANAIIPGALKSGASGVVITMLTTRLVLILILVVMSSFGAQKMNDRGLLLNYITSQLGIQTPVQSANTTQTSKDGANGSVKSSTSNDW
jgi:hypothetical protein